MNPESGNDNFSHRPERLSADAINILAAILLVTGIVLGLFLYAKRWKEKSDAANCVMNIRNFQTIVRSYAGVKSLPPGDPVDIRAAFGFAGCPPYRCPAGGTYAVHGYYGDPPGTVFLRCSHSTHAPTPAQSANW